MTAFKFPVVVAIALAGAAFLVSYHVRHREWSHQQRPRYTHWPWYAYVDAYLKASTIVVVLGCPFVSHPLWLRLYESEAAFLTGSLFALLGWLLFMCAMRSLREQYSPAHDARTPDRLIRSGPYRYVRHPIYAANLLILTGLAAGTGSLWLLINLAILATFYSLTIPREERCIAMVHPGYREYRATTGAVFPRWR